MNFPDLEAGVSDTEMVEVMLKQEADNVCREYRFALTAPDNMTGVLQG